MLEADRQLQLDQVQESDFERLLLWLDADREKAGEKYEQIRQMLMDYFRRRGAIDTLSLADEVIVRVTKRVAEVAPTFVGPPSYYFLGVARRVIAEYWRRPVEEELKDNDSVAANSKDAELREFKFDIVEKCWAR